MSHPILQQYTLASLQAMEFNLRRAVAADGSNLTSRRQLLAVTSEIGRRRKLAEEAMKPISPFPERRSA